MWENKYDQIELATKVEVLEYQVKVLSVENEEFREEAKEKDRHPVNALRSFFPPEMRF